MEFSVSVSGLNEGLGAFFGGSVEVRGVGRVASALSARRERLVVEGLIRAL